MVQALLLKAVAALLAIIIVAGPTTTVPGGSGTRYLYVTTYTFKNSGAEAFNLTEDDATIPLFHSNSWQNVIVLNATHPIARELKDVDGNRLAVLDLPASVPPGSSLVFSVTYEIESYDWPMPEFDTAEGDLPSAIPPGLVEEFCVETETFTAGEKEILGLAHRLAANERSVLGMVNQLLGWFIENISYGYREVPRYPEETLSEGLGDCDDQAILLVTMCRALGIPAILQVGVVFNEGIRSERSTWGNHLRVEQRGIGWHGWALVYIPPWGWLPIDMTLVTSRDSLSRIAEAPEHQRYIVTCFNVSRQEYVGDSLLSRARLMSSELYVTVSDVLISSAAIEEGPSVGARTAQYIILILTSGSIVLVTVILIGKRWARM